MAAAQAAKAPAEELEELKRQVSAREQQLLPIYSQIAIQFADLHDRADRMKAKDVIRDSLVWSQSRRFFYWRVRRRLNEEYILRRMATITAGAAVVNPSGASKSTLATHARERHMQLLEAWSGIPGFPKADREVAVWYEENKATVSAKMDALRADAMAAEMRELVRSSNKTDKDSNAAWKGVRDLLRVMPVEEKEKIMKYLKE